MKRRFISLAIIFSFLIPLSAFADWKTLSPGFEYRHSENSKTHIFRIDPKRFRFELLKASDNNISALTGERYHKKSNALLVINGGFFDDAFRPLGLIFRNGKIENPIRETAWGIFLMKGKESREPKIISKKEWNPSDVDFALQVGPRLVIDNVIPKFLEARLARRSGVGITREGWIEIALTESPMSLSDWAKILNEDCAQALNLDGGGSSQIFVQFPDWSLEVAGSTTVPDALAVFPAK